MNSMFKFLKERWLTIIILIIVTLISVKITRAYYKNKYSNSNFDIMQSDSDHISKLALKHLVSSLKVYDVYDNNNNLLKLIRHGKSNDGGYVVPETAFLKSEALLGYGIANDISFEEMYSDKYNKHSYGFDCSIDDIKIHNPLTHFVKECIGNNKHLYQNQDSSNVVTSFTTQLSNLSLNKRKVFIKMDIEGAEYKAFEDIYSNSENITGVVLEIHFGRLDQVLKANYLISILKNNFYLVHVHANNCVDYNFESKNLEGKMPRVMELTFINKNLVNHASLSLNQKFPRQVDMPNCAFKTDYNFIIK